jgi:FlgN protein
MKKNETKIPVSVMRQRLELLKSCLGLMQAKTRLLMRHDLAGLEAILVEEAQMVEQLNSAQGQSRELETHLDGLQSAEWGSLEAEMRAVVREIQVANHTNARLIQNGQQFCEVLYRTICPPETYSPSLTVMSRPVEATFRANY